MTSLGLRAGQSSGCGSGAGCRAFGLTPAPTTEVFGLTVGTVFGWMSAQALADQGVSTFAYPVGQIALAVLASAIAGTLAAVMPARRAARVDVLRALAAT